MTLRWGVGLFLCIALQAQARTPELPEFAGLVERLAPVVVNISATRPVTQMKAPALRGDGPGRMPDWLKRWLPPPAEPEDIEEDDQAVGSGFVIDASGYILTNAHVVEDATEILVRMSDRREYPARVVGTDRRTDIALLKLDARRLPQARLGDPARLRVGDWVLAIGSPFGFDSSVTAGIVSAKGRSLPDDSIVPFIQTDVAINPGNSGGPLFNLKGEVVGINSQIYSRTGGFMGVSFAIPIDVAMDVQAQLRERGHVQRGRIGVLVQELSQDIAESFGLRTASGALVSQVESPGPAAAAGLRSGDVILRCDGREVQNSNELPRIVGAIRPGREVDLEFWRENGLRRVKLVVGAFPEEKLEAPPRATEPVPRGANPLGLVLQDLSRSQKRELALEQGAAIVEAAGVAARAELRPGDVVLAVTAGGQQQPLKSAEHFNRLLQGLPRGAALTLLVLRGDSRSYVGMKLPVR